MPNITIPTLRERLRRFTGRYPEICERSGLSYSWINKFANSHRGKRPSFELITRLAAVLDELEAQQPDTTHDND